MSAKHPTRDPREHATHEPDAFEAAARAPGAREPDALGVPLRAFLDPHYRPLADNLQALRDSIDAIDRDLIALIARRAMFVKDAARFKADRHQVAAPARQAEVFARARSMAQEANRGFDGLEDVVDATWRAMVAAFIAQEGRYFDDMVEVGSSPGTNGPDPTATDRSR